MSSDPIRELLAQLEDRSFVSRPADCLVFSQAQVVQAGGDPDAVATWVKAHDGYLDQADDHISQSVSPNPRVKRGQTLYVVPRAAVMATRGASWRSTKRPRA